MGSNWRVDPQWEKDNLVEFVPPWQMLAAGAPKIVVKQFQVHRKVKSSLENVFNSIWDRCGKSQGQINAIGLQQFGGSFNFRLRRTAAKLSVHAFGAALDLNPQDNPLGGRPCMAQFVIDAFRSEGWTWGGSFHSTPDPMHFEATTPLKP